MPSVNIRKCNIRNGQLIIKTDPRETLRLLYSPTCPYCQQFMPVWEKYVADNYNLYKYERLDCSKHGESCSNHNITGIPAIFKVTIWYNKCAWS